MCTFTFLFLAKEAIYYFFRLVRISGMCVCVVQHNYLYLIKHLVRIIFLHLITEKMRIFGERAYSYIQYNEKEHTQQIE